MNYDFNENDEILDPADTIHEQRDIDVKLGKRIAREKKYNALVGEVTAEPMDDDCLTSLIERDLTKEDTNQEAELEQPCCKVEGRDASTRCAADAMLRSSTSLVQSPVT